MFEKLEHLYFPSTFFFKSVVVTWSFFCFCVFLLGQFCFCSVFATRCFKKIVYDAKDMSILSIAVVDFYSCAQLDVFPLLYPFLSHREVSIGVGMLPKFNPSVRVCVFSFLSMEASKGSYVSFYNKEYRRY